jgi:hypothetical protein
MSIPKKILWPIYVMHSIVTIPIAFKICKKKKPAITHGNIKQKKQYIFQLLIFNHCKYKLRYKMLKYMFHPEA